MTWLALFAAAKAELGSDKFASQLTMGVKRKLQIYAHSQRILCPPSFYVYSIGLRKVIIYFIKPAHFHNIIPKCFVPSYQHVITCHFWSWCSFLFRSCLCQMLFRKQRHSGGKKKSTIDEKKLRCERKELVSLEKKYLLAGEIATHGLL